MKTLHDYLVESKKTYPFKIGVAGELPDGFNERLKTALEKFSIVSISSGKKTPIQERPLDFPNLENMEVTYWDAELNYPTTESILQEYLQNFCSVPKSHVIVRNPNSPAEQEKEIEDSDVYEPLLTNADLKGESAQQNVGQSRIMDLLKELETARKERSDDTDGFKTEAVKEEPQNTKSAIGSKK
jgi:hypothetical protein